MPRSRGSAGYRDHDPANGVRLGKAIPIASVKVVSDQYIDYLQLGKVKGLWLIINVLWVYR